MKSRKDYHIHSKFSSVNHAKDSVEEIVKVAISKNLSEIAITNHGPAHIFFGIRVKQLAKLRKEIDTLNKKYPEINILLGVECNITSLKGDTDITDEVMRLCDIILCGFHVGVSYKNICDFFSFMIMNNLAKILPFLRKGQIRRNTTAITSAMNRYNIDILTHPGEKLLVDMELLAKAAELNGVALEINNSHEHLSVSEIVICSKYDVKFSINSDAHKKERVGGYSEGLKRAISAGINLNRIINLNE